MDGNSEPLDANSNEASARQIVGPSDKTLADDPDTSNSHRAP